MKTIAFETREEWLEARRGKITGSRLKDIVMKRGNGHKMGFYELIAERLAVAPDEENPMDRGLRLEEEAMARFVKETGKKVDTSLVIWAREDNESIAVSPDGFIGKNEAVEVKCLSSASHIKTWLTKKVPDDYEMQRLQYFIVNEKLTKLYFAFYDPRIPCKDFFVFEIKREEVQQEIDEYLAFEKSILLEVDEVVNELTF